MSCKIHLAGWVNPKDFNPKGINPNISEVTTRCASKCYVIQNFP